MFSLLTFSVLSDDQCQETLDLAINNDFKLENNKKYCIPAKKYFFICNENYEIQSGDKKGKSGVIISDGQTYVTCLTESGCNARITEIPDDDKQYIFGNNFDKFTLKAEVRLIIPTNPFDVVISITPENEETKLMLGDDPKPIGKGEEKSIKSNTKIYYVTPNNAIITSSYIPNQIPNPIIMLKEVPKEVGLYDINSIGDITDSSEGGEEDDNHAYLKQINEKAGTNCDDIVQTTGPNYWTIKSKSSLCFNHQNILINSEDKLYVRATNYAEADKFEKLRSYINPLVVQAELIEIKCAQSSDCKVAIAPANIEDSGYNLIVLQTDKFETNFTLDDDTKSVGFTYYHSETVHFNITATGTEFSMDDEYDNKLLTTFIFKAHEGEKSEVLIKITPNPSTARKPLAELAKLWPELYGRFPGDAEAFTANDLSKEYKSPGSVTQENSEAGKGDAKEPSSGLSPGAIVGIVIAVIIVIVIIVVLIWLFVCRPNKKEKSSSSSSKKKDQGSDSGSGVNA